MRQKAVWFLALTCTAVVIAACNILIQAVGAQPVTKSYLTGGCDTPQTPFCDALMGPESKLDRATRPHAAKIGSL
jgi:hypothetical protein